MSISKLPAFEERQSPTRREGALNFRLWFSAPSSTARTYVRRATTYAPLQTTSATAAQHRCRPKAHSSRVSNGPAAVAARSDRLQQGATGAPCQNPSEAVALNKFTLAQRPITPSYEDGEASRHWRQARGRPAHRENMRFWAAQTKKAVGGLLCLRRSVREDRSGTCARHRSADIQGMR